MAVQHFGRLQLHDPARFHHGDAVGDRHRLLLVVRDVDGRDLEAFLQPPDLAAHLTRSLASRLDSGSSNSSTRGRITIARARATRCCWPPESSFGSRSPIAVPGRPAPAPPRRACSISRGDLSHPQAIGDVLEHRQMREQRIVLEHKADVAPVGGTCVTSWSPIRILPDVGCWKPAIMRKVVVLPQPDGPEQRQELAGPDVEVDIAHRCDVAARCVLHGGRDAFEAGYRADSPRSIMCSGPRSREAQARRASAPQNPVEPAGHDATRRRSRTPRRPPPAPAPPRSCSPGCSP